MDPYIKHPEIWSDFHGDLAAEIRAELNRQIQPRCVARLTPRVAYEEVEIAETEAARPDVGVWRSQTQAGPAVKPSSMATQAPVQSVVPLEAPLRLDGVSIHEVGTMQLVTALEFLSPLNKRRGHEAHAGCLRQRRELLRSEVHLLEIDLLRGGHRPPLEKPVPAAPYCAALSRTDRRPAVDVWPMRFSETLQALPVPLPPQNIGEEDAAWLDQFLRERKLR